MKQFILLLIGLALSVCSFAQSTWTLEKCIQQAKQNNASLKQAEIAIRQTELTEKAHIFSRLPTINGNLEGALNFGRTVDPSTNNFINQQVAYNSFGISASATIFNGGKIKNSIKQSGYNTAANKAQAAAQFQNLALDITMAYLGILLAKEQLITAQKQLAQSKQQLEQIDKRIEAGSVPASDRLELQAQIARNEQTSVSTKNTLARNYLNLKNYLQVEPNFPLNIELPDNTSLLTKVEGFASFPQLYAQALQTQSIIKAGEFQIQSAALNIPIVKADLLPRIAVMGSINSRYSNVSNYRDNPYFNQVGNNLGQSIGVQVSIPIYNNHRTQIATERARLSIIDAEIQQGQNKQQLKSQIQNALADADGARMSLQAAEKTVAAAQASYDNAILKYKLGAINSLEYSTTKTNLDTAELDLIRAKYDYLFRLKIIDFYKGDKLSL